jgi:anaerobic ribonucleoside-triphosphate reductase activating protein
VTVLGGEPFEQADAVADLLERLRRDGLSTMVYSGHTWESLKRSPQPGIARLLATVDLLVDGPFLPEFYEETLAWRGSSNQRLLCLTDRYEERTLAEAYSRQKKGFSIQIGNGSISLSGLQSEGTARAAEAWLAGASLPPENLDAEVGAQTF